MNKELRSWGLLIFLAAIWGSSFILMKRGMVALDGSLIFSDTQVAGLRMSIAALALLPFSIKYLKRIKRPFEFLTLAVVGFCGNFFPAFLFTYSETGVSSGYAGMLNSFTPIFALLIGFIIFKQRLNFIQLIGVSIGTGGIILLMLAGKDLSITGTWWHILAIVLATFLYGISLNTIKHTLQGFKAMEITSLAFFILLPFSLFSIFQSDTITTIQSNNKALEGLFFIAILALIGTAFAVILFNRLIADTSTLFASSVTYFIPVFAVLIGFFNNETLTWNQIGAMGIILIGVFLANRYR